MSTVAPKFDAAIHPQVRLKLCAMLMTAAEVEFGWLRDQLEVSDSVLSKHLRALDELRYLELRKASREGRVYTWCALTRRGRTAFDRHVAELQRIAEVATSTDDARQGVALPRELASGSATPGGEPS